MILPNLRRVLQHSLRLRAGWPGKAIPFSEYRLFSKDGRGSQETNQRAKKMDATESYSLIYTVKKIHVSCRQALC